ncbi:hypothetical protein NE865_10656 [Phthorimaea operculella]|nr:hypothetical protein NE865_10656 [Phthorimaea operculella]
MPSKVVKCANCNIVINELLAFVNNKISVMDDESISRICVSAFSESDIVTAKNMLFDSMPTSKRKINRKRQGKQLRDIDDIICALRDTDSEEIPVFVAHELEKLPPVSFDHVDVTRLLKDIVKLQQDIKMITKDYATVKQVDALRCEVDTLKQTSIVNDYGRNVNIGRRGACLMTSFECHNSGPMGLPPGGNFDATIQHPYVNCASSSPKQTYRDIGHNVATEGSQTTQSLSPPPLENNAKHESAGVTHDVSQLSENESTDRYGEPQSYVTTAPMPTVNAAGNRSGDRAIHTAAAPNGTQSAPNTSQSTSQKQPSSPAANDSTPTRATISHGENTSTRSKSAAEVAKEGNWKPQTKSDEWIRVEKKKLRNRFVGNRGKACLEPGNNFKAAETKVPVYIYNVAKGVSVCDITDYIKKKTDIEVNVDKETWLLPHDIGYLGNIDDAFAFTGTSAVDTSAGVLRGRSYGGVALLWRKIYMPTDCSQNLVEFTECLGEMAAVIESHNVESVYMLGDFNAHPGTLFSTELLSFCSEQLWSCVDMELLPSDCYTFDREDCCKSEEAYTAVGGCGLIMMMMRGGWGESSGQITAYHDDERVTSECKIKTSISTS